MDRGGDLEHHSHSSHHNPHHLQQGQEHHEVDGDEQQHQQQHLIMVRRPLGGDQEAVLMIDVPPQKTEGHELQQNMPLDITTSVGGQQAGCSAQHTGERDSRSTGDDPSPCTPLIDLGPPIISMHTTTQHTIIPLIHL